VKKCAISCILYLKKKKKIGEGGGTDFVSEYLSVYICNLTDDRDGTVDQKWTGPCKDAGTV
jgi:hypothetical protein